MTTRKKPKVKEVKFDIVKNIDPDFEGADGIYKPGKNTIWLNKNLPEVTKWPKRMVLAHEMAHAKLSQAKLSYPPKVEEYICDLLAIVQTPNSYMSYGEAALRKALLGNNKLNWRKASDRTFIVGNILEAAGVTPTRYAVNCLSGLFPMKAPKGKIENHA